jgi:hypothetical protein
VKIEFKVRYPRRFTWAKQIADEEYAGALERAAEGQGNAYSRQFYLDDAVASGLTLKSIEIGEVERQGDRMSISVGPRGDRADIAAFIELGRGPGGFPPPDVIREWLLARKIISATTPEREVRMITYLVGRSIAKFGVEPRFIFEKAETHYARYIKQIFEGATRRIARRINERLNPNT